MCGRFTIAVEAADLQQEFGIPEMPSDWTLHYNVAPTQPVAVLTDAKGRKIEYLRWGLIPGWAKDITIGNRLINARAETIMEKPSFRSAFLKRRCLILADGFYEWQRRPGQKGPSTPFRFQRKDEKPFALAGIWEIWHADEPDRILSCTIITCLPNELVAPVHDRMPVMFSAERGWDWLEWNSPAELQSLLVPFPAKEMKAYEVGRLINDANNDSPECIRAVRE
jgi:putative SOS response-associated peptidase YedK